MVNEIMNPYNNQWNKEVSWCVCVQVFLCGVCGPDGRPWLGGDSHQRRPLELLHVRPPEHLWVAAAARRLALQTTTLLRQQPWTELCESDGSLPSIKLSSVVHIHSILTSSSPLPTIAPLLSFLGGDRESLGPDSRSAVYTSSGS